MLTGKMVRVRYARNQIVPYYLDTSDSSWIEVAGQLLEIFRSQEGRTRGELEEDIRETFGDSPAQLVHQGLAKLLEDRCEFEVVSGLPPEQLREEVFTAATWYRNQKSGVRSQEAEAALLWPAGFDRQAVLQQVAEKLGLTPEMIDRELFADLKSEQRLIRFKDTTAERLLDRYNVALAQAVLLRSRQVEVAIHGELPRRYRQLMRAIKFHRLICDVERTGDDSYLLRLDGPLSLFSATNKYGLQLALFLPAVLHCQHFELKAELLWGAQRKPKTFLLTPKEGLVSHAPDTGMYVPAELRGFIELFRKRTQDWDIAEETRVLPLGDTFWVPDFRLIHQESKQEVYLEVLGYWRRSSAERHLERLRQYARVPFLLAVSDLLHIEDAQLEGLSAGIHRFRQMPLPDEIVRLAEEVIQQRNKEG